MDLKHKVSVDNPQRPSSTRPPTGNPRGFDAARQRLQDVSEFSTAEKFLFLMLNRMVEFSESDLLRGLQLVHERRNVLGVYCKRFMAVDLNSPEKRISFQREAAVFLRKMHNKFFVPVWAAAMDETDGYILCPLLTPLRHILPFLKISERPRKEDETEMIKLMRRCFLPVAMAIDALHTPIPNHRTMYYHRDICIDNVYLYQSASGQGKVYGDAMLKLTKLTRGSHEQESLDVSLSIGNHTFPRKYFHHPAPWKDLNDNIYHRKHDWFSFGVYILEVLFNALPTNKPNIPFLQTVREYLQLVTELENFIETTMSFSRPYTKQFILQHLHVARTCLTLNDDDLDQVLNYELPTDLTDSFDGLNTLSFEPYSFEYGVSNSTAQLMWLYDDSRPQVEDFRLGRANAGGSVVKGQRLPTGLEKVCQACLFLPVVKLPTRTYRRGCGSARKCDEYCTEFYCIECYTNRERLFCPDQHGTASTIIGHYSSYALILYGDDSKDTFKKDATTIENVLKHKLICGIPDRNVSVRPVFDPENPGTEEKCLKEACLDMRRRIHNRQLIGSKERETDTCVNDASYTLFIFYSGHGAKGGHWTPYVTCSDQEECVQEYRLEKDVVDRQLKLMRQCTNVSNPTCSTACIEVTYVLDQCYTVKGDFSIADETDSSVVVTTRPATTAKYSLEDNSELTRWFCQLMRCIPYDHVSAKTSCATCEELQYHISKRGYNSFLDGHCLEIHKRHMRPELGFESKIPRVNVDVSGTEDENPMVIAYYHPKGVYYKVFSFKEGREPVEVRFHCQVTCEQVRKELIAELKKKDEEKERRRREYSGVQINICLLANLPDDHSKYTLVSDDAIRSILDSSLLFYHVITQPVQVLLVAATGHDIIKDTLSELELDKTDLLKLVNDCNKENPNPTVYRFLDMPTSQLPNIFVHIVHHLRYKEYQGGVTAESRGSRSSSSSPSDGHQLCQPSTSQDESDVSDQERVRNSFASLLYRVPRTGRRIKDFSPADWEELEGEAIQYLRGNRNREFDLRVEADNLLRVQWHMSSLELPLPDSLTRTRNVSEAGQYQSDDEVLPVLQSSPADDEDGYDG